MLFKSTPARLMRVCVYVGWSLSSRCCSNRLPRCMLTLTLEKERKGTMRLGVSRNHDECVCENDTLTHFVNTNAYGWTYFHCACIHRHLTLTRSISGCVECLLFLQIRSNRIPTSHCCLFSIRAGREQQGNGANVVRTALFNKYARKRASTSLRGGTSHFFLGSLSIIFVIGPSLTWYWYGQELHPTTRDVYKGKSLWDNHFAPLLSVFTSSMCVPRHHRRPFANRSERVTSKLGT